MADRKIPEREIELLALRALAGDRVALLFGRRRYTLTVDPIFRIEDGGDGFLYLCSGLECLKRRIQALAGFLKEEPARATSHSELGGAREPH